MKQIGGLLEADFEQIVETCPEAVAIYFQNEFIYVNPAGVALFKAPSRLESILGKTVFDISHPEYHTIVKQRLQHLLDNTGLLNETIEEKVICYDGTILEVEVSSSSFTYQEKTAIQVVFKDISLRKETEKALQRTSLELAELSAPLVPVMDQIAILPLIGLFDQNRIESILKTVPSRVSKMGLHHLIIDCSGMISMNLTVYAGILQLQKILSLLGIQTAFTGIRPDFAMESVKEGYQFSGIQSYQSVQRALQVIYEKALNKNNFLK